MAEYIFEINDALFDEDTGKAVMKPKVRGELIRCKDCKWGDWYTSVDGKRYCYCMETGNGGRTENDFCSYAERETDE